jgi:hypothetical protein
MFLLALLSGVFTMLLTTQHMLLMKISLFLQSSVNIGWFPVALGVLSSCLVWFLKELR